MHTLAKTPVFTVFIVVLHIVCTHFHFLWKTTVFTVAVHLVCTPLPLPKHLFSPFSPRLHPFSLRYPCQKTPVFTVFTVCSRIRSRWSKRWPSKRRPSPMRWRRRPKRSRTAYKYNAHCLQHGFCWIGFVCIRVLLIDWFCALLFVCALLLTTK